MSAPPALPAAPAGFWRRYAAWSLDWMLLGLLLVPLLSPLLARAWRQLLALNQLLQDWVYARVVTTRALPSPVAMSAELLHDPVLAAAVTRGSAELTTTLAWMALCLFALSGVYFIAFETSRWQATPGKRALRLRVCTVDGGEPGFARAALRHAGGALSWLLLNLGHALVAWRRDRRAMYDLIAGTKVIAEGPMPAWARLWLLAQGAMLIAIFVAALGWFAWQLWRIAGA